MVVDFWRTVAAEAFDVSYDDVTLQQRTRAKRFGWMWMYSAEGSDTATVASYVRLMSDAESAQTQGG